MARSANRILGLAAATATLLSGLASAQSTVDIAATSLDQVAEDNFLNSSCLLDANPTLVELFTGDTVLVPLECCGTQSFTCGGAFCTAIPACAAVETGVGSVDATAEVTELIASITSGMSTATFGLPPPADASTTGTATSTDDANTTGEPTSTGGDNATTEPASTNGASTTVTSTSTNNDGEPTLVPIVIPVPTPDTDTPGTDTPEVEEPEESTPGEDDPEEDAPEEEAPEDTPEDEPQEPEPTTTTSAATTSSTATETSSSSSATPTPKVFMFTTRRDTSRSDFDALVETVPDGGAGRVIAYDNIPWQSYVSFNLTQAQADEIAKNELVDLIREVREDDGEAGVIASPKKQTRIQKREDSPRTNSDYHLGILSAPKALRDTLDWPDYEFDTTLGKGQTIYVIDTGYRKTHSVSTSCSVKRCCQCWLTRHAGV